MQPRAHVNFRIGSSGVDWLDLLATEETTDEKKPVSRSDVLRASLAVARKYESEVRTVIRTAL
jgi:hypothetical protein